MASSLGFVIRTVKLKEYDLIVDILTQDGLSSYYVKNGNRGNSKRKQKLEVLNLLKFSFSKGKKNRNFKFINEIDLVSKFSAIKDEESMYVNCFLLAEILSKVLVEQEDSRLIFELLVNSSQLDWQEFEKPKTPELFIYITINILNLLGFLPTLNLCQKTQAPITEKSQLIVSTNPPGYIITDSIDESSSSNQDSLHQQQTIKRALKTQKYFCEKVDSTHSALKLNLPLKLVKFMTNTQLDWVEEIIEKRLKSRSLLNI